MPVIISEEATWQLKIACFVWATVPNSDVYFTIKENNENQQILETLVSLDHFFRSSS